MKKTLIAFALGASLFAGGSMAATTQLTKNQISQLKTFFGDIQTACGTGATCPVTTILVTFSSSTELTKFEQKLTAKGVPYSVASSPLNSILFTAPDIQ